MAYRSEDNKLTKQNYQDLNLTFYPNVIDSRISNINMRGFVNIGDGDLPDYVMAEYVNAALDGVMALERALGVAPMVPYGTEPANTSTVIENSNVASRITRIENGLFDVRYGGTGWNGSLSTRPTLSVHNHDGLNGHPGKINLTSEIEGILQKININLTSETGITGADIAVSKTNPLKINAALADTLSLSNGGTVVGSTTFKKAFSSRTHADFVADELPLVSGTLLQVDTEATAGKALTATSTGTTVTLFNLTAAEHSHMLFGKYVVSARLKTSSAIAGGLVRFTVGTTTIDLVGTDFTANKYKQVYFVFEQNEVSKLSDIRIQKLATASNVTLSVDAIYIEPIHPAVLDR